ncbi:hypothetical protein M0P65_05315 [Candidatus Gracilibacteria bacterium]|nr:hypothetical protein [Candidatus Gracilibacteria bacterium]
MKSETVSLTIDLEDIVVNLNKEQVQVLLDAYEKNQLCWDVSGPLLVRCLEALSDYSSDKNCPYNEALKVLEWAKKEFKK